MEKNDMPPNRDDPEYIKAVLEKKSQADPKEIAIREKIEAKVLREKWARDAFSRVKELQISYLKEVVANVEDSEFVHDKTQSTLREISSILKSKIVEGPENLARVPKGSPALIMTNHFGAYKLMSINPKKDLGVDIPNYEAMYPYLMYFAALCPVAQGIEDKLYYVSEDFPFIFGRIHTEAGFLHVPPKSVKPHGKRAFLQKQTEQAIRKGQNVAFVNFPEGGTSGKYSGKGPYDLDPFNTGGYAVAANLRIHVIPVAQYFDKDEGYQLKVLKPFVPDVADKDGYQKIADSNMAEMQSWFDQLKNK